MAMAPRRARRRKARVEMVDRLGAQSTVAARSAEHVDAETADGPRSADASGRWHEAPGRARRPPASASASAASSPPTSSTSSCARARSPPSSAPTAPARRRCSTCSPAPSRPTPARCMLNGEELVGLEPAPGRPQGHGALVPGRAPVQPAVVPAERDDGRAGPAGRELRARSPFVAQARSSRAEARDAGRRRIDWLGFVGMAEFADVPAGALSYGQTKLDLAGPGAGHRGRRAAARRAGIGHRHQVGRHDARPHRAGPRPGPHGVRRRAQPARRRPPRRPHVLHGARARSRPRAPSPSSPTRRDSRRSTLEPAETAHAAAGRRRRRPRRCCSVDKLQAGYGRKQVVFDVDLHGRRRARSSACSVTTAAARAPRSAPILGLNSRARRHASRSTARTSPGQLARQRARPAWR